MVSQSNNGFYVMDPCASPPPKNAFFGEFVCRKIRENVDEIPIY